MSDSSAKCDRKRALIKVLLPLPRSPKKKIRSQESRGKSREDISSSETASKVSRKKSCDSCMIKRNRICLYCIYYYLICKILLLLLISCRKYHVHRFIFLYLFFCLLSDFLSDSFSTIFFSNNRYKRRKSPYHRHVYLSMISVVIEK